MPDSNRADPDRHRDQVRAANRARARAVQILISRYPEEFAQAYSAFCADEDPPVEVGRRGPANESIEQKIARHRLHQVAKIYLRHIDDHPVVAVQQEMGYANYETAKRRVGWAREAGLLPPTTPGRTRI